MKVIVNLPYRISTVYKKKASIFMDYREQCISQQLISANSSLQSFITHVLIDMIDSSELFLVEISNALIVIDFLTVFFFLFTKCYKKLLSRKYGDLGFQVMLHLPRWLGFVFKIFEEEQSRAPFLQPHRQASRKTEFLPLSSPDTHQPGR